MPYDFCNPSSKFTFVDQNGAETAFVPAQQGGRARIIAQFLADTFEPGITIGLLYQSEPNLLLVWFASLLAGYKPLILQYPTRKQTRKYWSESIADTIRTVGIGGIIADDQCSSILRSTATVPLVAQCEVGAIVPGETDHAPLTLPADFSIVQLSSGTTGFRKAIEFSSQQLKRHSVDYNTVLELRPRDRIASWLPLYHDMGYVACFVMPLLLSIDVVMIDPITWVQRPEMLFEVIERHQATVCYMPNFGFEVMARMNPRPMPSMRKWVSCSEPVSDVTSRKFIKAIEADPQSFSPCYAMAENIFAVSMAVGCRTHRIDEMDVVSCGKPIAGVDLKIVEGEIWARSPTSIIRYIDGPDIRDAEGFYPTGDLGEFADGELFVSGRKQDLLIQAGRKFILSDIDLRLNEVFPEIRGRAATLALRDERIGTETPLVLIETPDFYGRTDDQAVASTLKNATGLDQVNISFVPPRFLTKTSSGKVNRRKTRKDWLEVRSASEAGLGVSRDPAKELRTSFPYADWTSPVKDVLDSLSRTILRINLETASLALDESKTLNEIDQMLRRTTRNPAPSTITEKGIRIVSLSDRNTLRKINNVHLDRLEEAFGCKVTLEHVCLPPSPILFSDLVFYDYFRPRLDRGYFTAVGRAMEQLKGASILIADDVAEFAYLYESTYPVLSHNLERNAAADLISFRWQQYTRDHHRLPLSVACGIDIPLSASNQLLPELGRYLGAPVFRIATIPGFRDITHDWEHKEPGSYIIGVDPDAWADRLIQWAHSLPDLPNVMPLRDGPRLQMSDLGHFCSHMVNKAAVDLVLSYFDRFCIAGEVASAPYVRHRLEVLGKPYVQVPSHAPAVLDSVKEPYDCVLLCGPVGNFPTEVPMVALQHADSPWRTRNLGALADSLPQLGAMPFSEDDWFHPFSFQRMRDYKIWSEARRGMARKEGRTPERTAPL